MNLNQVGAILTRNRSWVIPISTGIAGFISGTAVGVSVVLRKKNKQISDDLESLAAMTRETARTQTKFTEDFETKVLQLAEQIVHRDTTTAYTEGDSFQVWGPGIEEHPGMEVWDESPPASIVEPVYVERQDPAKITPAPRKVSIFTTSHDDDGEDDWDINEEMENRSPDAPYVIHREEFDANELDFRQSSWTYYAGDQVLTDEKDAPQYDVDKIVGELKFGHGSQDRSICYIRNEALRNEYEVILDQGSYMVQILGEDIEEELEKRDELKHSSTPKFRKD